MDARCDDEVEDPLKTAAPLAGGVGPPALLPPRLLGDDKMPLPVVGTRIFSTCCFLEHGRTYLRLESWRKTYKRAYFVWQGSVLFLQNEKHILSSILTVMMRNVSGVCGICVGDVCGITSKSFGFRFLMNGDQQLLPASRVTIKIAESICRREMSTLFSLVFCQSVVALMRLHALTHAHTRTHTERGWTQGRIHAYIRTCIHTCIHTKIHT